MRSLAFSREMFPKKENRMLRGTTSITAIRKKLSSFRNLDTNSVPGYYLHILLIHFFYPYAPCFFRCIISFEEGWIDGQSIFGIVLGHWSSSKNDIGSLVRTKHYTAVFTNYWIRTMARQWFKRIQRGRGRVRFNRATSRIGNVIGGTMQKIQYPTIERDDRSVCTSEEVVSLVGFPCTGDGNACLPLAQEKAAPEAESHDFRVRYRRHLSVHESFSLLFYRQWEAEPIRRWQSRPWSITVTLSIIMETEISESVHSARCSAISIQAKTAISARRRGR